MWETWARVTYNMGDPVHRDSERRPKMVKKVALDSTLPNMVIRRFDLPAPGSVMHQPQCTNPAQKFIDFVSTLCPCKGVQLIYVPILTLDILDNGRNAGEANL